MLVQLFFLLFRKWRSWLFLSLVFVLNSPLLAMECGKIVRGQGPVEVLSLTGDLDEQGNPVRRGARLHKSHPLDCQDIVITGPRGRCVIQLKGTRLTMGPNSRIAIAKFNKSSGEASLIHLTFGKVRAVFGKAKSTDNPVLKDSAPRFRIRTQSAVVGVRGTDFYTKYEPNSGLTQQATLSGQVEVEQRGSGQKVTVAKGQQVDVSDFGGGQGGGLAEETMGDVDGKSNLVNTQALKPLIVQEIQTTVVEEIQDTSVLAKTDKEFAGKEALKILGQPESWKEMADLVPPDLKNIKNEF